MEQQLEKLTNLGTAAVQDAIQQYTQWFIASAITWLTLTALGFFLAVVIWRSRKRLEDAPEEIAVLAMMAVVILPLIFALTLAIQIPTLLNPRAYAIRQLIMDAR